MTDVTVSADLVNGGDQCSVANWFFDDQASVRAGDLLCEVMVEKATLEVRAPTAGRLTILAPTESIVTADTVLARIE